MYNSQKNILTCLNGEMSSQVPFWFMRQAGRYLPEYKELRKEFSGFLEFCYTPEAAAEATIQPIKRFGMSAAIIFSDILVIPHALSQDVKFVEGEGPVLEPLKNLEALSFDGFKEHLKPVYKALQLTKEQLQKDTALIGFCGAPWTLACYMIEGKSSKDFGLARRWIYTKPKEFDALIEILITAITQHAIAQIEAGAEIIQLFDSWAGVLSEDEFEKIAIIPIQRIVTAIKEKHPHIPIIGFPRMCGSKIEEYIKKTGVNAVSIDGSNSLAYTKKLSITLQGNLDPVLLADNREHMLKQAKKILQAFAGKPHIFNLSHGVLPHTPIAHMEALCDLLKNYKTGV